MTNRSTISPRILVSILAVAIIGIAALLLLTQNNDCTSDILARFERTDAAKLFNMTATINYPGSTVSNIRWSLAPRGDKQCSAVLYADVDGKGTEVYHLLIDLKNNNIKPDDNDTRYAVGSGLLSQDSLTLP